MIQEPEFKSFATKNGRLQRSHTDKISAKLVSVPSSFFSPHVFTSNQYVRQPERLLKRWVDLSLMSELLSAYDRVQLERVHALLIL